MTAHFKDVMSGVHPAKHPLPADNLDSFASAVAVFTLPPDQLTGLMLRASLDLPGLADADAVLRVMAHNPDSVIGIAHRDRHPSGAMRADGFVAFLRLTADGVRQLIAGTFDASDPDPALLCRQNEIPAGIYLWAMWARDGLVAGIPLAFDRLWSPLHGHADIYARAVTASGKRLLETMGFMPGAQFQDLSNEFLHSLQRDGDQGRASPPYDTYRKGRSNTSIAVTVARSMEDLMRVMSIRSAVYIGEQRCPYRGEFDGNDFSASHLLGYVGHEPIGCVRIRCFADFAKIERLAVRKEFRAKEIAPQLVEAAIALCHAKGYQRLYGHAQKRLVKFWSQFGFSTFEGGQDFVFSDFDYVEMQMITPRQANAVSIGVDPYLTIRPEGRWHRPGILENSRVRPVTHPSIDKRAV